MTFREFLSTRRSRFDARGDFVRLAKDDQRLPEVTSWVELRAYMAAHGTSFDPLEAGRLVWAEYQDILRAKRQPA